MNAAGKPGEQLNLDVDGQKGINAELGLVGAQVNEQKQGDEVKQDKSGDMKQNESGDVLGESTDVKQDENRSDKLDEKQVQGERVEKVQGEEQIQRTEEIEHEKELQDRELAQRLALLIENANARIAPLLTMVHQAGFAVIFHRGGDTDSSTCIGHRSV